MTSSLSLWPFLWLFLALIAAGFGFINVRTRVAPFARLLFFLFLVLFLVSVVTALTEL
jgi:uncharacterized membrane protein YtjA (UPF0391 family)